MTKDAVVETITTLAKVLHENQQIEKSIERRYSVILNKEREPYRRVRTEAEFKLEKIREDPLYIQHFAIFKPGDFVKKGGDLYEVVNSKLQFYYDDDNPPTICVRVNAYEIRWNGERGKFPMTFDQEDVELVPETYDKRLLKRVKKRIIQRLEGAG